VSKEILSVAVTVFERFKGAGVRYLHYGFHSISTALVSAMLLQARKANAFHRARATNAAFIKKA